MRPALMLSKMASIAASSDIAPRISRPSGVSASQQVAKSSMSHATSSSGMGAVSFLRYHEQSPCRCLALLGAGLDIEVAAPDRRHESKRLQFDECPGGGGLAGVEPRGGLSDAQLDGSVVLAIVPAPQQDEEASGVVGGGAEGLTVDHLMGQLDPSRTRFLGASLRSVHRRLRLLRTSSQSPGSGGTWTSTIWPVRHSRFASAKAAACPT